MTKRARPLSPHLSIYSLQITSALSILHRITGIGLFLGLLILLWHFIAFTYGKSAQDSLLFKILESPASRGIVIIWSYSLFFHICTGIRHLFWDAGLGLSLKHSIYSGWAILIISIALTAITWIAALQLEPTVIT